MKRKPKTVLDKLEVDGVIDSTTAEDIRRFTKRKPAPLTDAETMNLQLLAHCVIKPLRADARAADERAFWMAYERLYYESIGNRDATTKTAKHWKVSRRTVTNAAKRHSGITMRADPKRDSDLQRMFSDVRKKNNSKKTVQKT